VGLPERLKARKSLARSPAARDRRAALMARTSQLLLSSLGLMPPFVLCSSGAWSYPGYQIEARRRVLTEPMPAHPVEQS